MINLRKILLIGIVIFVIVLAITKTLPGSAYSNHQSVERLRSRYKSDRDTFKIQSLQFLLNNYKQHGDDSSAITADLLDRNITDALTAAGPALRNGQLTFDDFCEYVLPYRIGNEPYEDWRTICIDSFAQYHPKKPIGKKDYVTITATINDHLRKDFTYQLNSADNRSWSTLIKEKSGNCTDMARMIMYPLRTMGIPVSEDFTTCWGNVNGYGHTWNALLFGNGSVPFLGVESNPGDYHPFNLVLQEDEQKSSRRIAPKVFRRTFSIPFKDMTEQYTAVTDIEIDITDTASKQYSICVFNSGQWTPVFDGRREGNQIIFQKMANGLVYLPIATNKDGTISQAADPIALDKNGHQHLFQPDTTNKINVTISTTQSFESDQLDAIDSIGNWLDVSFQPTMKRIAEGQLRSRPLNGQRYTLFYWQNTSWHKAATAIARNKKITFKKVPFNALYRLIGPDSDEKERVFSYRDGEVRWY